MLFDTSLALLVEPPPPLSEFSLKDASFSLRCTHKAAPIHLCVARRIIFIFAQRCVRRGASECPYLSQECCTSEFQTLINAERYQRGKQPEGFLRSLSVCFILFVEIPKKHAEICVSSPRLLGHHGWLFRGMRIQTKSEN
jgi:hypothetical protein